MGSPPVAMAGASQPWYMPATWPLGHVSAAITKDKDEKPNKPSATPYLDLSGNLTAFAAAARSWCLAYLCIFYLPGKFGLVYPAFGPGKTWSLDWMSHILIRNVVVTVSASCFAALIEILLCHAWATGMISFQSKMSDAPYYNLAMALLLTHYRIPHFHLMHRA